jgi:S-DNA-T family DNA segregation ATPase FtsK/SpoIIIE
MVGGEKMKKEETAVFSRLVDSFQWLWLHRKGNEVVAAIQDTINALWREALRPVVISKKQYPNKWTLIIALPPGMGYVEFKSKEHLFHDATGGAVIIDKHGKAVIMEVLTERLQERYSYEWDWNPYSKMNLPVPFGYSAAGLIVRDLADAPNLLVAGTPGSGKSNFLHVLAVSLLLSRQINLCIVDLKRLEFSYLRKKALLVTDLEKARDLLQAINKRLDQRLEQLEKAGVVKIQDYAGHMPYIVVIIDELAEMVDEHCQTALNRILRLGRAAGVCVVAATQRPSSSMFAKFGDSKAMFSASMCFHVRDELNSRMVLDNGRAALIPNIKGRAVYQWETELEVQSMFLPVKQAKSLIEGVQQEVLWYDQSYKRLPPR